MGRVEVAVGIIHRGNQILICRRGAGRTFAGVWEFPGGKCEPGELPCAALTREIGEELGVRIELRTALAVIEHDYPTFSVRLHPFVCKLTEGEPRPISAECLRWIDPAELRHLTFPPANTTLIERIINLFEHRGS